MSKVGGALPSWYWPPAIPRRVAVPQQPLARILLQRLGRGAQEAALGARGAWVSRGELLERARELAGGIAALEPDDAPVAVVERESASAFPLLVAAWLAGRRVLLADATASAEELARQLDAAEASTVLTDGQPGSASRLEGVDLWTPKNLEGESPPEVRRGRATEAALLIPSSRGVVVHSHFSLSAMATSLLAFVKELRGLAHLSLSPLWSWEGLAGTLGALLHDHPVIFSSLEECAADPPPIPESGAYTILPRAVAEALLGERRAPEILRAMRYVFVSTGPFKLRWRRALEDRLGKPVLPLWGLPELGPVVVAHPSWFPVASHGFALVNVSLVPLDPAVGQPSVVPWEMLTRAEVGVDSLSAMLGYARAGGRFEARLDKVTRTRQIAGIDHVGVVTLHDVPPPDEAPRDVD